MDKFEEYKFFVDQTQRISERRQSATQSGIRQYFAVNTGIFAVLAIMIKDANFRGWRLVLVSIPLFIVGIFLCFYWRKTITQVRKLIGWRYDQLITMEKEIPESYGMFTKEWINFYKPTFGKRFFSITELSLTTLFLTLYLYGVIIIYLIAFNFI